MTNGLFDKASVISIDPNKDYSAELVGEGKRFATIQDLARSALEKELHIRNLETETKEMRDDLAKRATAEEILAKIAQGNTNTNQSTSVHTDGDGSSETLLTPEHINALINQKVSEAVTGLTAEAEAKKNIEMVRETLSKTWGSDFPKVLKEKAVELGVTEDWITQAARTTPKVLLALVTQGSPTQNQQTPSLFVPSPTGINTAGLARNNEGNLPKESRYSYWQEVRKENPTYYHSVPAAAARHEAAKKYGEAFFNN